MKTSQTGEKTASDCGCRNQCIQKFSTEDKISIIDNLYNRRPKNEFDPYLLEMINCHEIRRRRRRSEDDPKKKACSFSYSVMKGSQKVMVCRKAFIHLHAVSHKAVYRLTNILANTEIAKESRRRSSQDDIEVSGEVTLQIDNHIRSFPEYYIGRPVTYLGAQLTVRTMYKLFCTRYPELKETVSYEFYLKYFKEHFYRPRDIEI